ncbi:diacylglycerol kinase family protein [Pontibacillus salicampi]|uniref:Diacylglycerol kinase family protein n=1 Tax=Pontibacillus salicampi TaxID=1449801 RepID=A0ABV6LJM7_9BACI
MSLDSKENKKRKLVGFTFAWNGLKAVSKAERNFRIHLMTTLCVCILAAIVRVSFIEWAVLTLTVSLVLTMELINSAVERIMDFLSPTWHPLVGEIKDITAGAVLVTAIAAIIIGCFIFIPYFI